MGGLLASPQNHYTIEYKRILCSDLGVSGHAPRLTRKHKMTYDNTPDYFPADWAAILDGLEAEVYAILGEGFNDLPSPTDAAIASGRSVQLHS